MLQWIGANLGTILICLVLIAIVTFIVHYQVFRLSAESGMQKITHSQEQPEYSKEYLFPSEEPITAKIFVIDDETHTTMLLAEEY